MRIDSHQHFWEYDPVKDNWIDDSMKRIRRDFYPEHLRSILETNHIDGCIAVQADQLEKETRFLLDLTVENSFIKGVVGWVDLCAPNVENSLVRFSENGLFKGVRHILQAENTSFFGSKSFQNGISKLAGFDLTYDILIHYGQLSAAIELVEKFPDQQFILDHIAKPDIKNREIQEWRKGMAELAKFPNVYCKVSGMLTEADWRSWNNTDFQPYLDVVFQVFGVERILYGSDWPVCLLAGSYKEQLHVIEEYISSYSLEDQLKVMGGNAIKFYNLKP